MCRPKRGKHLYHSTALSNTSRKETEKTQRQSVSAHEPFRLLAPWTRARCLALSVQQIQWRGQSETLGGSASHYKCYFLRQSTPLSSFSACSGATESTPKPTS